MHDLKTIEELYKVVKKEGLKDNFQFWIGGYREMNGSMWLWSDRSVYSYNRWRPDNADPEKNRLTLFRNSAIFAEKDISFIAWFQLFQHLHWLLNVTYFPPYSSPQNIALSLLR